MRVEKDLPEDVWIEGLYAMPQCLVSSVILSDEGDENFANYRARIPAGRACQTVAQVIAEHLPTTPPSGNSSTLMKVKRSQIHCRKSEPPTSSIKV